MGVRSGIRATNHSSETKLELAIDGPAEVVCGDKVVSAYLVKRSRASAMRECNASLIAHLVKPARGFVHGMGVVAAGETKMVEIELTARQSGHLSINAEASQDDVGAYPPRPVAVLKTRTGVVDGKPAQRADLPGACYLYPQASRIPATPSLPRCSSGAQLPRHLATQTSTSRVSDEQRQRFGRWPT